MGAGRIVLLALVAVSAAIAPSPARAKEELIGVVVCGADRCAELYSPAVREASGILSDRSFRRSGPALPFYDVIFVWRNRDGGPTTNGALRWVPKAGATRTWSRGPVWSRAGMALTAALSAATLGLRPRPARRLDDPVDAVGPATASARRTLARPRAAPLAPGVPKPVGGARLPEAMASLALVLPLAIVAAVALRHSRRSGPWSPRRRPRRSGRATSG
jgi:hypothetical protein